MYIAPFVFLLVCLPSALLDFATPRWKADPNIRIEDAYKWTYQATRGGEHAIPDAESARKWLDSEWQTLGTPFKNENVWEPLCPGSEIGRLNLRPFVKGGGKPDDLIEAFLTGSREIHTDKGDFTSAWNELGRRLEKRSAGKLTYKTWADLDAKMKPLNYPAIHHSSSYETARRPAYRVLTGPEMAKLLKKH